MTETQAFQAKYTPRYEETLKAGPPGMLRGFSATQWLLSVLFALPIFVPGLILTYFKKPIIGSLIPLIGFDAAKNLLGVVIVALTLVIFWLHISKFSPWITSRWLTERKPPIPTDFYANNEGLIWESELSKFSFKWQAFEAMYATPTTIAFLVGAIAMTIPMRAFSNQAEVNEFIQFSLKHLPETVAARAREDKTIAALLSSQ